MNTLFHSLYLMVGLLIGGFFVVQIKTDQPISPTYKTALLISSSAHANLNEENVKTNKKAISELDKKLKILDPLKDLTKRKALEAMKKHIEEHLNDDPSTVLKDATKAAKKAAKTGDKIKDAGMHDYLEKVRSAIGIEVFGLKVGISKGTGQTTGHIATLSVQNTGNYVVDIVPETFYIPSSGRYQSYVGAIPPGIQIPPGGTRNIPINGNCADPHSPPVPAGTNTSPFDEWVPVHTEQTPNLNPTAGNDASGPGFPILISSQPTLPSFQPSDINPIKNSPSYTPATNLDTAIILTWPGTDIVIGGYLDPSVSTSVFAPVIVGAYEDIIKATPTIQAGGIFITPFSQDSTKEAEAIIQHSIWIFAASLEGDPYKNADFAENVYDQFQASTGMSITAIPDEQKEKVDEGIEAFWNTFKATGVEAKVLKADPTTPEYVEVAEKVGGCSSDIGLNCDPQIDFDMKITEEWADARRRARIIRNVRDELSTDVNVSPEGVSAEYDINRHPTSSTAFWKCGTIGGFASAYAKTWFTDENGNSEWVWGTERLPSHASGTMDYTMSYTHDSRCRAIVAGTALIRIRASSSALDAVAGNTQSENDTDQLNFLRGTKYAAKKAIEWLILRSRGRADKPFGQFLRDDIRSQVEGEISSAVEAEIIRFADQYMGQYLESLGLSMGDLMNINLELPDLHGILESALGIDIPSMEDLEEFMSDGLDAALNLFFVANTYATANGSLTVTVGDSTKSVLAHTTVRYARQSTEETSSAIQWTGEQCQEAIISDSKPESLTIHTNAFGDLVSEALSRYGFGNGSAEAFLESMNLQILAGVCICNGPAGAVTFTNEVEGQMGWYTATGGFQTAIRDALNPLLGQIETGIAAELNALSRAALNNLTPKQLEEMLERRVTSWADSHKFAWGNCE